MLDSALALTAQMPPMFYKPIVAAWQIGDPEWDADTFWDALERRIPELMALLAASPPQLRSLQQWFPWHRSANPASALPAEIGALSQLTSLELGLGRADITTGQVAAVLVTLPSLQRLALGELGDGAISDGFPVSIATCCLKLQYLTIQGGQIRAIPSELGRLTALMQLDLQSAAATSLPESISRLKALENLTLTGRAETSLPIQLTECLHLTRLVMDSDIRSPALARLKSLRSLEVTALDSQLPREMYWTQLTALTELKLWCDDRLSFLDDEMAEMAAGMAIIGGQHFEVPIPAALSGMTSLRKLHIRYAKIHDLPPGPYLCGLESLIMTNCVFLDRRVPSNLAAAAQLLNLEFESDNAMGIDIAAHDIAVLSSLHALETLHLPKPDPMDVGEWERRVAALQAAFFAAGHAPPALSG